MSRQKITSSTTLPIMPGTVILLAILLLLLTALFAVLYRADLISLPVFVQKLLPSPQTDEPPDSTPDYLATLSGTSPTEDNFLSLSSVSLSEKILSAYKPETLYQYLTVTWTAGNMHRTWEVYYITCNGARRADVYENGQFVRMIIERDGLRYVCDTENKKISALYEGFSFEAEVGLPSLAHLQELLTAGIQADFATSTFNQCSSIQVTFTDPDSNTRETYEILPDTGVIVSVASILQDAIFPHYYMTTKTLFTSLTVDYESLFEISE